MEFQPKKTFQILIAFQTSIVDFFNTSCSQKVRTGPCGCEYTLSKIFIDAIHSSFIPVKIAEVPVNNARSSVNVTLWVVWMFHLGSKEGSERKFVNLPSEKKKH